MNTLLDLTKRIDASTVDTLCAVDEVTKELGIPYIIIGATARDLVLHYGYGKQIQRATHDIDFAIQVEVWSDFDAVIQMLCANAFKQTRSAHRLISPAGRPVDIVPFGGIEQKVGTISWPPNGDTIMSVVGFRDVCKHAQLVLIKNSPQTTCPVATPEGLTLLKLISWADRDRGTRTKDADDINFLLRNYEGIKNVSEMLYNEYNFPRLEQYEWDLEKAASALLGSECRKISSNTTQVEIVKLQTNDNHKKCIRQVAEDMKHGAFDRNLVLLGAFMEGFGS